MPKTVNRLDSISTWRERVPTNPKTAYKNPNMVWDHSRQMAEVPARVVTGANGGYRTMNANGQSAIPDKGISVGGAPDHSGKVYRSGDVSPRKSGRGGGYSPNFKGR